MSNIWLIYGLASAATIGFAALSRDMERVKGALILALGWVAANQFQFVHFQIGYPLMDMLIGYMIAVLWLQYPQRWKAAVFGCTILQLCAHVIYQAALAINLDNRYAYQAALNALFVCQLLAVSGSGIKRGLMHFGRLLVDRHGDRMRVHGMARDAG